MEIKIGDQIVFVDGAVDAYQLQSLQNYPNVTGSTFNYGRTIFTLQIANGGQHICMAPDAFECGVTFCELKGEQYCIGNRVDCDLYPTELAGTTQTSLITQSLDEI